MDKFTEKELVEPGWYWFVPTFPDAAGNPHFARVSDESMQEKWLHCRKYEGEYFGPINPAKIIRETRGEICPIEVSLDYLHWVNRLEMPSRDETPEQERKRLTDYVNEVLSEHRRMWDVLHDPAQELPPTDQA